MTNLVKAKEIKSPVVIINLISVLGISQPNLKRTPNPNEPKW